MSWRQYADRMHIEHKAELCDAWLVLVDSAECVVQTRGHAIAVEREATDSSLIHREQHEAKKSRQFDSADHDQDGDE